MREKEYEEYNALTKRLLEEGYSAEHHPDYVRVDIPMWQEKTLDNYDGGFTYEKWWIVEQTFKTPCSLQCKGIQCHSNMSYMGIEWTFENDMATIHCPYEKKECKLKFALMLTLPAQVVVGQTLPVIEEEGQLQLPFLAHSRHGASYHRKSAHFSRNGRDGRIAVFGVMFRGDSQGKCGHRAAWKSPIVSRTGQTTPRRFGRRTEISIRRHFLPQK